MIILENVWKRFGVEKNQFYFLIGNALYKVFFRKVYDFAKL